MEAKEVKSLSLSFVMEWCRHFWGFKRKRQICKALTSQLHAELFRTRAELYVKYSLITYRSKCHFQWYFEYNFNEIIHRPYSNSQLFWCNKLYYIEFAYVLTRQHAFVWHPNLNILLQCTHSCMESLCCMKAAKRSVMNQLDRFRYANVGKTCDPTSIFQSQNKF